MFTIAFGITHKPLDKDMYYSLLAFLLTLIEISAAVAGYTMHSELIFYNVVVYGSPFYMIQHAIGPDSLLSQKNPVYWAVLLFHLIKYFVIIQSQRREERNILRTFALLFEALYLALSAYYLL